MLEEHRNLRNKDTLNPMQSMSASWRHEFQDTAGVHTQTVTVGGARIVLLSDGHCE